MSVIGVGIDLVDLASVARLLEGKGERALQKLFTQTERDYLTRGPNPTGHAAARIAAKEAVYKAMQSLPGARAIGPVPTNPRTRLMPAPARIRPRTRSGCASARKVAMRAPMD